MFCVPGRVTDKYSQGCNNLIKTQKANVLTSAADLVYILVGYSKKTNPYKKQLSRWRTMNKRVYDYLLKPERTNGYHCPALCFPFINFREYEYGLKVGATVARNCLRRYKWIIINRKFAIIYVSSICRFAVLPQLDNFQNLGPPMVACLQRVYTFSTKYSVYNASFTTMVYFFVDNLLFFS
jgi:hypothetical protein